MVTVGDPPQPAGLSRPCQAGQAALQGVEGWAHTVQDGPRETGQGVTRVLGRGALVAFYAGSCGH